MSFSRISRSRALLWQHKAMASGWFTQRAPLCRITSKADSERAIDKQTSVDVYVSLLDVRSRTVYDSETGDPAYRIVNYVSDTDYSYIDHVNYCIPKEA